MSQQCRSILGAFMLAGFIALTSGPLHAQGTYTQLQVLVPGESPAPGTGSGKTGMALTQTAGVPFTIQVRACDSQWNTVPTVTNVVEVLCSDASADLPASTQLVSGEISLSGTLNADGTYTIFAHDHVSRPC